MAKSKKELIPYDATKFSGSASSYAGQGVCSFCGRGTAEYMNQKATHAYCEGCAENSTKEIVDKHIDEYGEVWKTLS